MDHQYIEDLRALEDKKEAKEKLIEYAEQFGIKVKKTRSFDNLVLDIESALKELASEPMPEVNEGLSISDLIDADDDLEGKNDFVSGGDDEVKPEARLLFDAPVDVPAVAVINNTDDTSAPVVAEPAPEVVEVLHVEPRVAPVEPPVDAPKYVVEALPEFKLPDGFSPTLAKIGPGNGYCTLPWWIYEWIVKTPDWKEKPNSFPHHYGIPTVLSLIYYINREGSVRIRETRNSRFYVLN